MIEWECGLCGYRRQNVNDECPGCKHISTLPTGQYWVFMCILLLLLLQGCTALMTQSPKPHKVLRRNWTTGEWSYECPDAKLKRNWIEDRWEY